MFSWWVLSAASLSHVKRRHAAKDNTTQTDAPRNQPVVELVGRDVSRGGLARSVCVDDDDDDDDDVWSVVVVVAGVSLAQEVERVGW